MSFPTDLDAAPPCVLFEDAHLLVVNKPAGINTHAPSAFAGEGIYDWLKHRQARWAELSILHRLDKETSGVIVFGKSKTANRSLTTQFAGRSVQKRYLFLTDRPMRRREWVVRSKIARIGERYASGSRGEPAETRFRVLDDEAPVPNARWIEAEPLTGRTHQIRVHATESGIPVLGDTLYGGTGFGRVCLHAAELKIIHPEANNPVVFRAPIDFKSDARLALRTALIDEAETNAYRLIHGATDGWPGWYVDRLGNSLLSQSEHQPGPDDIRRLESLLETVRRGPAATAADSWSVHHKVLDRRVRGKAPLNASPRPLIQTPPFSPFEIRENGVRFELRFDEGYSVGLFPDQRDNRRRLLTGHVAAGFSLRADEDLSPGPAALAGLEVLNAFAYTCGFSVCAALAGARTTSVDLSRKYLEWGKRNFVLNRLAPDDHDFIYGDVFDWLKRLRKKGRQFDLILLDPPTFSQSKEHGTFRAEKDYAKLVSVALPLLKIPGALFASTNAAVVAPEKFLADVEHAVRAAGRAILQKHYSPQPPDFPVSRLEPAYLKTVWVRID